MAVGEIVSPKKFEEVVIARRREASLSVMRITYMTSGVLGGVSEDEAGSIPYLEMQALGSPRFFVGKRDGESTVARLGQSYHLTVLLQQAMQLIPSDMPFTSDPSKMGSHRIGGSFAPQYPRFL